MNRELHWTLNNKGSSQHGLIYMNGIVLFFLLFYTPICLLLFALAWWLRELIPLPWNSRTHTEAWRPEAGSHSLLHSTGLIVPQTAKS
jgi:hypothetical protein